MSATTVLESGSMRINRLRPLVTSQMLLTPVTGQMTSAVTAAET